MATTLCPRFRANVYEVIQDNTVAHYLNGGTGICGFVWVTGPGLTAKGRPSGYLVEDCFPVNSLDCSTFPATLGTT